MTQEPSDSLEQPTALAERTKKRRDSFQEEDVHDTRLG